MPATRTLLIDALRYDLIGPMRPDEILDQRPTRWYLTGFLVPRGTAAEQLTDPTDDEQLSAEVQSDAEDDQGDCAVPTARTWFPSSCGLSVILESETEQLQVQASWGEYHKLSPLETAALWQKHRPEDWARYYAPEDTVEALPGEAAPKAKKRSQPPALWQRSQHQSPLLSLPLNKSASVLRIPNTHGLSFRVEVRDALSPGLSPGARTVSIFLVNERQPGEQDLADQQAIYQIQFSVQCQEGFVARTSIHQQDAPDFDEARVDLQYRKQGEWAVGHNVSTEALVEGGQCQQVQTTWLPTASVYRQKAREIPEVLVAMESLAALPDAHALRAGLGPLLSEYIAWIRQERAQHAELNSKRQEVAEALARGAERACSRIEAGIAYLEANPVAWEAFRLTNLVMCQTARAARPELYAGDKQPTWRLFQLAFLLLNIEGIAEPGHLDRAVVELLFFPTGGGKTEAYLGVAALTMLLRRLRHHTAPHEGAGVAVLLRYTLRMLTLDQLGRAATLICALEALRGQQPEKLGNRRFSIGLWVGRSATPNRIEDAEKQLTSYKANPQDRRRAPPMPLTECPWCRTPFGVNSYAIRSEGVYKVLRVGCVNEECTFHFDRSADRGVPVVVIDDQIYRELPTFLIATVDKFAGLPRTGVAGALFGRVKAKDAHGFYTDLNAPTGATRFARGLLPLELILQDELHLITGPLGTMVGLYETILGELCREPGGARPKLVASTATARGAQRQIQALYGARLVETFPPPGLDPGDTFFARNETDEAASRQYVGVAAPGRNVKAISVRVYSSLLSTAQKEWDKHEKTGNPVDTYMTLVCYFNTLRELGGAQRLIQEEVAPRCGRLLDRHAFQDSHSPVFARRYLAFDPLELTSRQSTDQIRLATAQLRASFGSETGKKNDVFLASSMISVGVDIPRLGLMVMNGQPKTVAEYIQATSRVGRETPGLVVTLLNVRRPRDRSHYERFASFHHCFYRMVESSSVTPFSARALDRGLAGVLVALARHLFDPLNAPKKAQDVNEVAELPSRLQQILKQRAHHHQEQVSPELERQVGQRVAGLLNDWSQIAASLQKLQISLTYSSWELKGGVSLLSTVLDPVPEQDARLERFRAPTSMRDVEAGVHLWVVNSLGGDEQ